MIRALHIFDFDGTLFRSPHPPEWADGSWWATYESLDVPNVPLKPDASWWVGSTVSAAKASISNSEVYAAVVTGRKSRPDFRYRIAELLKSAGLNFDSVHLNEGGDTKSSKVKTILSLLRKYPSIEELHIWEDRGNHLSHFISTFEPYLEKAEGHLVKAKPKPPTPGRSEVVFTEMILDHASSSRLKQWFQSVTGNPLYSDTYAHHVTIQFEPSISSLLKTPFGKQVTAKVTGYVDNGKIQAVSVDPKGFTAKKMPHVTVATTGSAPVGSAKALRKGTPVDGPVLKGVIGYFDGKEHHMSSPIRQASKVASLWLEASSHKRSVALMQFLSQVSRQLGVGKHVYVVGGAVRNWIIDQPIKDIDVMIDSVALRGKDSDWFAKQLQKYIPAPVHVTTNQYGVAIVTVKGDWVIDGENLDGEVIEIANARKESYGGTGGKGYKPHMVEPTTVEEDIVRREFTFNCMVGDTLVPTEKGICRIDQIAWRGRGDQQRIDLEVAGQDGPAKAVGWQYSGYAPTLRVTTEWGHSFACTHHHPVLVLRGHDHEWVQADQLEEGDLLCVPTRQVTRKTPLDLNLSDPALPKHGALKEVRKPEVMTPELAFVIGCIVAEGSNTHKRVSFSNSDESLISRYVECFHATFGFQPSRNRVVKKGSVRTLRGVEFVANADGYDIYADSKTVVGWLSELGLYCGGAQEGRSASHHKVVPWSILEADEQSQWAFLAAYLEGDGSIRPDTGRITFCSASLHIRQRLQVLLGAHGILSKVKDRFVYINAVDSALLWEKIQPWMVTKSFDYTSQANRARNRYGVPVGHIRGFLSGRRRGTDKKPVYATDQGELKGGLRGVWEPVRQVKRLLHDAYARGDFDEFMANLKIISPEEFAKLQRLFDLGYQYVEVSSVEDAGEQDVFDLSMEEGVEPAFVANGVVVHNTLMWRLHDLASGPDKAEIVDITGCGLKDLQEGVMRCPSSPDKTFTDDPTRMLRAIKFLTKYGFRIDSDVKKSILRNAHKIKYVPQNAIAKLLMETLLKESTGRKAVKTMAELGLLDPLADMVKTSKPFRTTLLNWAGGQPFRFLYDLLDLGFPLDAPMGFLERDQQRKFKEWVYALTEDEARTLYSSLKQPGKAWKNKRFIPELAAELGVSRKLMGPFAQTLQAHAREILLEDPHVSPQDLQRRLRNVAFKQRRTAGTFDAPPVMLAKATEWFLSKYAGHVAAQTQERIDSILKVIKPSEDPLSPALESVKEMKNRLRTLERDVRKLELGQVIKVPLTVGVTLSLTLHTGVLGIRVSPHYKYVPHRDWIVPGKPESPDERVFQYSVNDKRAGFSKRKGLVRPYDVDYHILSKLKKAIKLAEDSIESRRKRVNRDLDRTPELVELKLLLNEALKYTSKPKAYRTKAGTKLPVDVTGWKYIQGSSPESVFGEYAAMKAREWGPISISLHFDAHKNRGGVWIGRDKVLQVDVAHPDPRHVKTFQLGVEDIKRITRHEMQHVGQDLLRDIRRLNEDAGLPSRNIRDLGYDPSGNLSKGYSRTRKDHALRDVEFYTRISDEIGYFLRAIRDYPRKDWRDVARKWTDGDVGHALSTRFFRDLKRSEPDKWRKAVKVFISEVQKEMGDLKPRTAHLARHVSLAARVAAKYKNKKKVPKADGKGKTTVYEYSDRQVANRNREKAERVEKLRKNIGSLRSQYKKDLTSSDTGKALTALAVGLIDETYERVGNDESAKDGHFGVTGWQAKHVKFSGPKATVKYVGKSGVNQTKTIADKALVSALKKALDGKSGDGCVFVHEGDDPVSVKSKDVNGYLKDFGVTAKDLRGFHANTTMCQKLKANRKGKLPEDKKERGQKLKEEFQKALEETAKEVGHEASTLKSQYLVPGLEDQFLKDGTVSKSLKISKKTRTEKEDEAVAKTVKPAPKKKPPRVDLRNRRRLQDDDPDVDGQPVEKDRDLSLNYKKVALAHRVAAFYVSAADDDALMEQVEGKRFKNPETGKDVSFKSLPKEEQKKILDRLKQESKEDKKKDKNQLRDQYEEKLQEERVEEEKRQEEKRKKQQDLDAARDVVHSDEFEDYGEAFKELSKREKQEFATAYAEAAEEYSKNPASYSKASFNKLSKAWKTRDDIDMSDPAKAGVKLAQIQQAKERFFNPMNIGGGIASAQSTQEPDRKEKAEESFNRHSVMDEESRKEILDQVLKEYEKAPRDSARQQELAAVIDGLQLTSLVNGEKNEKGEVGAIAGRPEPSKPFRILAKALSKDEAGREILFSGVEKLQEPGSRDTLVDSLQELSDEEFLVAVGQEDEQSPLGKLLSDPSLSSAQKEQARRMLSEFTLDGMLVGHHVAKELYKASGENLNADQVYEIWQNSTQRDPTLEQMMREAVDSDLDDAVDQFRLRAMQNLYAEIEESLPERPREQSPGLAESLYNSAVESGDPSYLEMETDPPLLQSTSS